MPLTIRRRSAFTLIELLVVVAIIGVLTLVARPAYYSYRQNLYDKIVRYDIMTARRLFTGHLHMGEEHDVSGIMKIYSTNSPMGLPPMVSTDDPIDDFQPSKGVHIFFGFEQVVGQDVFYYFIAWHEGFNPPRVFMYRSSCPNFTLITDPTKVNFLQSVNHNLLILNFQSVEPC